MTWDGKTSKSDVDVVVPRSEGNVLHTAAAILVVLARHFGLRGTLNGQTQTTSTSTPVEDKVSWSRRTNLHSTLSGHSGLTWSLQ